MTIELIAYTKEQKKQIIKMKKLGTKILDNPLYFALLLDIKKLEKEIKQTNNKNNILGNTYEKIKYAFYLNTFYECVKENSTLANQILGQLSQNKRLLNIFLKDENNDTTYDNKVLQFFNVAYHCTRITQIERNEQKIYNDILQYCLSNYGTLNLTIEQWENANDAIMG